MDLRPYSEWFYYRSFIIHPSHFKECMFYLKSIFILRKFNNGKYGLYIQNVNHIKVFQAIDFIFYCVNSIRKPEAKEIKRIFDEFPNLKNNLYSPLPVSFTSYFSEKKIIPFRINQYDENIPKEARNILRIIDLYMIYIKKWLIEIDSLQYPNIFQFGTVIKYLILPMIQNIEWYLGGFVSKSPVIDYSKKYDLIIADLRGIRDRFKHNITKYHEFIWINTWHLKSKEACSVIKKIYREMEEITDSDKSDIEIICEYLIEKNNEKFK